MKLFFGQNDPLIGQAFWQNTSLVIHSTMPILIFSPVQIIMGHPLPMQYKNSIVTSIQYEIKLFCIINAMIIYRNEMVGNKCMKAILLLCIWSRLSVGPKCDNTVIVHTDFN